MTCIGQHRRSYDAPTPSSPAAGSAAADSKTKRKADQNRCGVSSTNPEPGSIRPLQHDGLARIFVACARRMVLCVSCDQSHGDRRAGSPALCQPHTDAGSSSKADDRRRAGVLTSGTASGSGSRRTPTAGPSPTWRIGCRRWRWRSCSSHSAWDVLQKVRTPCTPAATCLQQLSSFCSVCPSCVCVLA